MKPFILNFSKPRTNEEAAIYTYDENLNLNVIGAGEQRIPFVESDTKKLELMTKTEALPERDEDEISLLELITKTKIARERDDD